MPPRTRKPTIKPTPQHTDKELDAQLVENVPDTFAPGYEGHQLRVAGIPWADIAKQIGSPTPRAAMDTVSRYLQEAARAQSANQQQEALQTQLARYEAVLRAWWPAATDGVEVIDESGTKIRKLDEKAALVVLRAMERLDRLLRVADSDVVISKETLVISADPAEYIKQLQEVVEARTSRPS